jgi:hypothetical protein
MLVPLPPTGGHGVTLTEEDMLVPRLVGRISELESKLQATQGRASELASPETVIEKVGQTLRLALAYV